MWWYIVVYGGTLWHMVRYATLLGEAQREYLSRRGGGAGRAAGAALRAAGREHCAALRAACSLLALACRDEWALYSNLFSQPSPALQ